METSVSLQLLRLFDLSHLHVQLPEFSQSYVFPTQLRDMRPESRHHEIYSQCTGTSGMLLAVSREQDLNVRYPVCQFDGIWPSYLLSTSYTYAAQSARSLA